MLRFRFKVFDRFYSFADHVAPAHAGGVSGATTVRFLALDVIVLERAKNQNKPASRATSAASGLANRAIVEMTGMKSRHMK